MIKGILRKYNTIPIAAKATLWFMICSIIQKSISIITTPIFTRLMSTEQYGQFSVYNSWLQIFTIITTFRLNWAVFNKGMSKYKNNRDDYTVTMQSITTILTTIVLVIYLLFRKQINIITELPTFIMLAMFAELYMIPAIDFWTVKKRYEYQYKAVVFRTLLMVVFNAVLGVLAVALTNEKGYARILSCVFVDIIFGFFLYIYNIRESKSLFCFKYAKFAILFNLPLLLHYLSQYILDQFDRIMIQKMVGLAAAGIYSVAYNAASVIKIVTQSINNALIPWQYEKLEKKEFKDLDDVMFLIFLIVSICALSFCCFAPELMMILASDMYYEAIYIIPPVVLGLFFSFMYTIFANVEFYYEANKMTMYISMSGAILNIILNYYGIILFGYVAAAYTTLICYMLFAILHYIYMEYCIYKKEHIKFVFKRRRLLFLSVTTTVCGIFISLLYNYRGIRLFLIFIVCLIGFTLRNKLIDIWRKMKSVE